MLRTKRTCLNCEALETRENPDGNVSLSVVGGSIFMQGDGVGNHIQLSQGPLGNNIVTGLNNTTINGQTTINLGRFIPINVFIHGDGGADRIEVANMRIAGTLTIIPGDENDRVDITNVSASVVNINMGAGNDTLVVNGLIARSALMLDGGSGYDLLHLSNVFAGSGYVRNFEQLI